MKAHIVSFERGLLEYDDVKLIRLKSPQITLLIMEDHMPLIGDIEGSIEIINGDEHICFDDIEGYYMHKKNIFELVLKD